MHIESPDAITGEGIEATGIEVVGTWLNGNVTLRFKGTTFEVDITRAELEQTIEVLSSTLFESVRNEAYSRVFEVMDEGSEHE